MSTTRRVIILFGAPLILVAGLGIFWGVEKGSALVRLVEGWARQLEQSPQPVAMAVGGLPVISHMHVDGALIGRLDSVVVLREQPGAVDSLRLVVDLDASVHAAHYADCRFLLDPSALEGSWPLEGIKHVVQCGTDTVGFARFGTIVFSGSGTETALYLEETKLPCDRLSDPNLPGCDDIRVKMRRLKEEIRKEIRRGTRGGSIHIQARP